MRLLLIRAKKYIERCSLVRYLSLFARYHCYIVVYNDAKEAQPHPSYEDLALSGTAVYNILNSVQKRNHFCDKSNISLLFLIIKTDTYTI